MSEGIYLSHKSPQSELDKLKGVRLIQTSTPSDKYNGYHLMNHDDIVDYVIARDGFIDVYLENSERVLVFRSAVFTFEYTGLKGIAHFNEKDNRPTD